MHIVCTQCDHPNELGHVFCVECGARLDLKNATEQIRADGDREGRRAVWKILWIFPVLILVVLTALAFWPCKSFYNPGKKSGDYAMVERIVERSYKMSKMTDASLKIELGTTDINAWLQTQAGFVGANSLSIKTGNNKLKLRVTDKTRPHTIAGKVNIKAFTYSYGVTCRVASNSFKVVHGMVGHLPLPGPVSKLVSGKVKDIVGGRNREMSIYESLASISISPSNLVYELKTETAVQRFERKQRETAERTERAKNEADAKQ